MTILNCIGESLSDRILHQIPQVNRLTGKSPPDLQRLFVERHTPSLNIYLIGKVFLDKLSIPRKNP